MFMDPVHVFFYFNVWAAGGIMFLGQVLLVYALAESRVIPWNPFNFSPGFGVHVAQVNIVQIHIFHDSSLLIWRLA